MLGWCVAKCVSKCVERLHTWRAARPRQHWGLRASPIPTTRPPRVRSLVVVRVVGIGDVWVGGLAGAGLTGEINQMQVAVGVEDWKGDSGEKKDWKGGLGWLG